MKTFFISTLSVFFFTAFISNATAFETLGSKVGEYNPNCQRLSYVNDVIGLDVHQFTEMFNHLQAFRDMAIKAGMTAGELVATAQSIEIIKKLIFAGNSAREGAFTVLAFIKGLPGQIIELSRGLARIIAMPAFPGKSEVIATTTKDIAAYTTVSAAGLAAAASAVTMASFNLTCLNRILIVNNSSHDLYCKIYIKMQADRHYKIDQRSSLAILALNTIQKVKCAESSLSNFKWDTGIGVKNSSDLNCAYERQLVYSNEGGRDNYQWTCQTPKSLFGGYKSP